jgi:hypothetical protein
MEPTSEVISFHSMKLGGGLVKVMLSFAMSLLILDPTFVPHRFGIKANSKSSASKGSIN